MATGVNVEVYQIMAEILVTTRRIVHRGLVKVSGPRWYEDGCPPGLFDRLVACKENELVIDRFDREYHELIGYASLDDLAEIIEFNKELGKRLEVIAPEGSTLAEMFREIESLRLKLAAAAPFDDDDAEMLYGYHSHLKDALERRARKSNGEPAPLPPPESEEFSAEPPDETADETISDVENESPELDRQTAGGKDDSGDFGTVIAMTEADSLELAEAQRAMADDDDIEVLRVIRGEVMVMAEGVLQNDLQREGLVWNAVRAAGWYDRKRDELDIGTLEVFFTVVEAIRETHRTGGGLEAIKAQLQVVGFSQILLALRDTFLKHGL